MFWNEKARRWEKHPDCTCSGPYGGPTDLCVCRWLRPLDANGRPMPYPIVDALREAEKPKQKAEAA